MLKNLRGKISQKNQAIYLKLFRNENIFAEFHKIPIHNAEITGDFAQQNMPVNQFVRHESLLNLPCCKAVRSMFVPNITRVLVFKYNIFTF